MICVDYPVSELVDPDFVGDLTLLEFQVVVVQFLQSMQENDLPSVVLFYRLVVLREGNLKPTKVLIELIIYGPRQRMTIRQGVC